MSGLSQVQHGVSFQLTGRGFTLAITVSSNEDGSLYTFSPLFRARLSAMLRDLHQPMHVTSVVPSDADVSI